MKVHNLVVTGSLQSGGENITSISSSVASTVTNVSSSVSASIGQLSSSVATSMTSLSSSLTASIGSLSSSMMTSMNDVSSSIKGMMATTGSNIFVGNQTISGSIVPAVNGAYDLGSSTHEFRHLYLSSASLYIDGTKVLGSTTQELQITTDAGQSFKILEAGSDTITLQAADGNITLATSGGGDVILDPTTGVIALKGTTTIYAGNRVLSSDGNAIQFGNSVTMTGSLVVTGFIETQELRTTYISSSILYRSGSTKFGDELTDTHSFTGSLSVSGSISVPGSGLVSGSSQISFGSVSGVPSGLVSGSSQVLSGTGIWSGSAQLPSGVVSGSSQILAGTTIHSGSFFNGISVVSGSGQISYTGITNIPSGIISGSAQLPSGTVSGSAQITLSSTTGYGSVLNQAVLTTSSPTFAGLTTTAAVSITATDGSGARTTPFTAMTLVSDNSSNPYDGFGTALLFRNRIYSGGPTPGGIRDGARIRTSLKNNSTVNYGTDLYFDVTPTGDGSLTNALSLSYDYGSRFSTNLGIGSFGGLTIANLLELRKSDATLYDQTVDNGQDGAGATLSIRNDDTSVIGSFSQINMQVSGDSGRALGRIVTIRMGSATSDMAFVTENSNVKSEKLRITSTGNVLPGVDASYNLGSTSLRWNNLYTTDLHLSNEGKQNVVDGTWGDWTLQEGENDIYMLNNRSGEKFKIKLEKIIE